METRKLEFKEGIETLTFPELKSTLTALGIGEKSRIEHFQVIEDVCELLDKHNLPFQVDSISVAGNKFAKVFKIAEEKYGEKAVEAHYLTKINAPITIANFENLGTHPQIRIEYHDRGLSVAFGKVVQICSNGMTAWRGDIATTFGKEKMNYDQIKEHVRGWLANFEAKNNQYNDLIRTLINTPTDTAKIINSIGKLEMMAVNQAYGNKELAPLNISQVSQFTKGIIDKWDSEKQLYNITNGWDILNLATEHQKPSKVDMATINETNLALCSFFINEFNLN